MYTKQGSLAHRTTPTYLYGLHPSHIHNNLDILKTRVGAHCAKAPTENVRAAYPQVVNMNVLLQDNK